MSDHMPRKDVDLPPRMPEAATIAELRAELTRVKAERERVAICPDCAGTGLRDSGGSHPWGEPISLPCDCGSYDQNVRRLRSAIMWARDRIDVDGGMSPREKAATSAELLSVLLGRPSPASSFAPVADFQSPTLKAIRAAKGEPE